LETVALVPLLVMVGTMMLQLGVAAWTTVAADTAARSAARAATLDSGQDPRIVANNSLPGTLSATVTEAHSDDGVRITVRVDVPRVSLLPQVTVQRDALMPKIAP
jgi:hypothetical protein